MGLTFQYNFVSLIAKESRFSDEFKKYHQFWQVNHVNTGYVGRYKCMYKYKNISDLSQIPSNVRIAYVHEANLRNSWTGKTHFAKCKNIWAIVRKLLV